MDFFNYRFLLNILKRYFTIVLFFFFVLLSIFLIFSNSNSVSAYTSGVSGSAIPSSFIENLVNWYEQNYSSTYSYFTIQYKPNDSYGIINVFNLSDPTTKILYFNNHIESSTGSATGEYFSFDKSNGNINFKLGDITSFIYNSCTFDGVKPYYYSNLDLYDNNNNILWVTDYSVFDTPKLFPPASSEQSELDALTSGQFTFFVVTPGSLTANQEILMEVFNTTYSDSADNVVQTYHLNISSPFYEEGLSDFEYVLTARFLDWFQVVNGNSYKVKLSWINPNNPLVVDSVSYSWTMSLTASEQEDEASRVQQEISSNVENINNSVNDINDFLHNEEFDQNSIVSDMPSSSQYTDPADGGLLTIFNSLYDAFTDDTNTPVRFYIPFTNGEYIDIPPDLTSSHVPQAILFIIQAFYWYLICRYIIKDISKTANRAKSGELLDSKDGNIRTDLL